jgi:tetratricopeptide (TPR) repeat protein
MRWILSLLCALLVWGSITWTPVAAASLPNYTEAELQRGQALTEKAIEATQNGAFPQAERYWTQLVEQFPDNPAVWSNRGNLRVRQYKLDAAIADYNRSIELAPDAPDPYLNRGAAYEGQGRYQEAIADYERVLSLNPNDALAYNNRGNAKAGQGQWPDAIADYQKAIELAPDFAFARSNYALALYQTGAQDAAYQEMRNLARKYPMFPDVRAALTAVLWEQGKQGEAESNWVATMGMDSRYQDIDWVKTIRRWPPLMATALEKFLNLE